jgi:pantetheine-phosphate adenylyltransferase
LTIALYPGSFDPVTNGHIDIVVRSSALFSKLIIGVYDLPGKQLLFGAEERLEMINRSIARMRNVTACAYSGLTVDFARKVGATVLVRGLRANSDFEYEFGMTLMNKHLDEGIEVVCLMSNLQFQFISSSLLKEVSKLGGNISDMVPPHVVKALREKLKPIGLKSIEIRTRPAARKV